jgi:hypothetical protein
LKKKSWSFKALKPEQNNEIKDWVAHIQKHIAKANSKGKSIPRVSNFWKGYD